MREAIRKMTDDPVVLRIMDQLEMQGKTGKELEKHLGFSNGTISAWKFANVKSYRKRIDEIAEYLGVTREYLLEGTEDNHSREVMTPTEVKLIQLFRGMGNAQQRHYMELGEFLRNLSRYERTEAEVSI
ncbi:MAG: hypothetical protein Q4A32_03880 [Lachnospiraceae bacterium]|nr:hypothetical protein [Lachnospiraceae bacterium]